MKNIIIILSAIFIMSCNKEDDTPNTYTYISTDVEFSVFDSENEDLLNPENPNHINESDISIYYNIDGVIEEVNNPNSDYPRNFFIFKHENEYRLRVFINNTKTSEEPITYVHWNKVDIDTIKATFNRANNSIVQDKIWLNGKEVWEIGDNTTKPYFTLIK